MGPMRPLLTLSLAYLIGCFSTAYYLVRWRTGQDIRTLGSGNAGATNAGRVLGLWGFGVAFVGDVGKGVLAVLLARWLGQGIGWLPALAVPAAVAGHIWPVQLRLRGGEGFATALGGFGALDPGLTAGVAGVAGLVYGVSRRRSLAGLLGLLSAPVWAWALRRPTSHFVALALLLPMMLWAFRRHLRQLFGGELPQ